MIGTLLNQRFQVSERLARQGATEIFDGLDLVEGRPVWVKRFEAPLDQELDFIANWRAQLLSIQAIDDGHLPRIYDFGRTPAGDLFQVEEPPVGMTLRRYSAARAPMDVAAAVALVAAVARAAGVGHREGIAHGGLTPESLYIEDDGVTLDGFVTGWEAGEIAVALRNAGHALPDRSMRYLAPEQMTLPPPPATPASDVYALGVVLYELLTGSLPPAQAAGRALAEPTAPRRFNPSIPVAVERVLLRALSHDPAARQPHGVALAQALLDALAQPEPQTVVAPPPLVEERVERVTVRPPAWLPALSLLAALLICFLLFLLVWTNRRDPATAGVQPTATPRTVPNLVGPPFLRYNEAVALAWNQGYVISIVGFVEGPNVPSGVVVTQCPLPGSLPGEVAQCPTVGFPPSVDTILVEVSSLPEPVVLRVVPDLYGQPEPEARAALEAGSLRLGSRREGYDLLIPAGRIIEQNPRRGLGVLPGTPVDVIVSAGPPPAAGLIAPIETPIVEVIPPAPTAALLVTETPLPQPTLALPVETPTATLFVPPPTETPPAPGTTVLLEDDFEEGNVLGWVVPESPGQSATIGDGVFAAQVIEPGLFWKSQPGRLFSDFSYEAEILLFDETVDDQGSAGLVFRIQDDEHFYYFELNSFGEFRLRARNDDTWVTLLDWDSVPEVLPAGNVNLATVTAEGERLSLFINGMQVAVLDTPSDVTYLNGDIGLAVEADTLPIEAQFDNVLVTR